MPNLEGATGTGGELWRAPSRRGKNASPAADRWPHVYLPQLGASTVAVWGAFAAFLSTSLIAPPSRDAPSSPPAPFEVLTTVPHRPAGARRDRDACGPDLVDHAHGAHRSFASRVAR